MENSQSFYSKVSGSKSVGEIDSGSVTRRFDKHASTYDSFAAVQKNMSFMCIDILQKLIKTHSFAPKSILELGCGTGQLTSLLCSVFPSGKITAIDAAPAMIGIASSKHLQNATFELSNIENFTSDQKYDLIVSSAAVQWLKNPKKELSDIHALLSDRSVCLHLTFGPKTFQEINFCIGSADQANDDPAGKDVLHAGFPQNRITEKTVSQWYAALKNERLPHIEADSFICEMSYPDAAALFKSINRTGASYTTAGRLKAGRLMKAIRLYDTLYGTDSGVTATYEIIRLIGSNYYRDLSVDRAETSSPYPL